jgi:prepilin-type N-terminal cleavage/methylation domain-containing protein
MKNKGFTLIELMVTVTIMMIMTLVVFFNYDRFNESSLLNSYAYDLSLTIRQAQTYGMAAKQGFGSQSASIDTDTIGSTDFTRSYGVHFDSTVGATPLKLFVDSGTPPNGVYDNGEELQSFTFQRGVKLSKLCVTVAGPPPSEDCSRTSLDITFTRPDPDATISSGGVAIDGVSMAKIVLYNNDESIGRAVVVYPVGQISVQSVQ